MANEPMVSRHDRDLYRGSGPGRLGGIVSRLSLLEGFQDDVQGDIVSIKHTMEAWAKKQDRQQWWIIATLIGVIVDIILKASK